MKAKSAIAKGKRLELYIAKEIEEMGLSRATRTAGSGSGQHKGDVFANIPFLLEVKNQEKIDINRWVDQAKKQAEQGNWDRNKWALAFRDPRTHETNPDIYVVLDLWEWLKLLKKDKEPLIKKPDRQMKWDLENLKVAVNKLLKHYK